jgi:hypothetical protein
VDDIDNEYLDRKAVIDTRSAGRRRKSASDLLAQLLSGLSPEARVQKLTEAANNEHLCPETRRTAIRYLKSEGVPLGGFEVDEDTTGADTLSI